MSTWLVSIQMTLLFGLYYIEARVTRKRLKSLYEETIRLVEREEVERKVDREVINYLVKAYEDLSMDYTKTEKELRAAVQRLLEELPSIDC